MPLEDVYMGPQLNTDHHRPREQCRFFVFKNHFKTVPFKISLHQKLYRIERFLVLILKSSFRDKLTAMSTTNSV